MNCYNFNDKVMNMSKRISFLQALVFLAFAAAGGTANALPYIYGALSVSGGLTDLGPTPPDPVTYITSQLDVLTGGVSTGTVNLGTTSGTYSGLDGSPAGFTSLNITTSTSMAGATVFHIGAFTFVASNIFTGPDRSHFLQGSAGNLSDAVTLRFIGTVSAANFQDTPFLADFTANGNCVGSGSTGPCVSNITGSWSASISSNDQISLPEPTSLSLLGIGFAALTALRRRKLAESLDV
jgi:hypothetical protein